MRLNNTSTNIFLHVKAEVLDRVQTYTYDGGRSFPLRNHVSHSSPAHCLELHHGISK